MEMTKSKPSVNRHAVAFAALLATAAQLFVGTSANAFQVLVAGAPLTGGDADGVYLCDTETELCTEFIPNIENIPFPVVNGPNGIYVGQFQSTIVQHYDFQGVLQKEILPLPTGLQLHSLAFGQKGILYAAVGNPGNNSAGSIYSYNAKKIRWDEVVAEGSLGLEQPEGLTYGPDGWLYVASSKANKILRFHPKKKNKAEVFVEAGGEAKLKGPHGLLFVNGTLLVVSRNNDVIQSFDSATGEYTGVFACNRNDPGDPCVDANAFIGDPEKKLNGPIGLVLGANGNILVSARGDSIGDNVVLVYDRGTGEVIKALDGITDVGYAAPLAEQVRGCLEFKGAAPPIQMVAKAGKKGEKIPLDEDGCFTISTLDDDKDISVIIEIQ